MRRRTASPPRSGDEAPIECPFAGSDHRGGLWRARLSRRLTLAAGAPQIRVDAAPVSVAIAGEPHEHVGHDRHNPRAIVARQVPTVFAHLLSYRGDVARFHPATQKHLVRGASKSPASPTASSTKSRSASASAPGRPRKLCDTRSLTAESRHKELCRRSHAIGRCRMACSTRRSRFACGRRPEPGLVQHLGADAFGSPFPLAATGCTPVSVHCTAGRLRCQTRIPYSLELVNQESWVAGGPAIDATTRSRDRLREPAIRFDRHGCRPTQRAQASFRRAPNARSAGFASRTSPRGPAGESTDAEA